MLIRCLFYDVDDTKVQQTAELSCIWWVAADSCCYIAFKEVKSIAYSLDESTYLSILDKIEDNMLNGIHYLNLTEFVGIEVDDGDLDSAYYMDILNRLENGDNTEEFEDNSSEETDTSVSESVVVNTRTYDTDKKSGFSLSRYLGLNKEGRYN